MWSSTPRSSHPGLPQRVRSRRGLPAPDVRKLSSRHRLARSGWWGPTFADPAEACRNAPPARRPPRRNDPPRAAPCRTGRPTPGRSRSAGARHQARNPARVPPVGWHFGGLAPRTGTGRTRFGTGPTPGGADERGSGGRGSRWTLSSQPPVSPAIHACPAQVAESRIPFPPPGCPPPGSRHRVPATGLPLPGSYCREYALCAPSSVATNSSSVVSDRSCSSRLRPLRA